MAEIAEDLCLTQRYLRAIEQDDLKSLPGTFFYKSFVRQYAAVLGVPLSQIQAGLDAVTDSEQEPAPAPRPVQSSRHIGGLFPRQNRTGSSAPIRVPDEIVQASNRYFSDRRIGTPVAMLVLVLLACSGFYAWWNQPASARTAAPAPAETGAVVPQPAPAAQPLAGQSSATQSLAVESPATANPAPAIAVTAATSPDDPNRVVLNLAATEKTWLSITSEGKEIFSGILQPSQTKTLTGLDMAKMKVGNAGGIEVKWNGKEIGPIGPRGQVRTILFTPENFEILEPPAPGPDETL